LGNDGLCQSNSTPHWHQDLQTRRAGERADAGRSRRMWRRISWGRDDAGMTGGPSFSLPFVRVNASDVDEGIEGDD
jgi:hypothetical protein